MSEVHSQRIQRLQQALAARNLDAIVVLDRYNTIYLTGFKCSYSWLIVDREKATFITDSRYAEAAEAAVGSFTSLLIQPLQKVKEFFRDTFKAFGYKQIGFEGSISVDEFDSLKGYVRGAKFEKAGDLLVALRMVKDASEIAIIRKAVKLADKMMAQAIAGLRVGITELEVARGIRFSSETLGGEGESFECIVASGPNSSRPHHRGGPRKLRKGDPITLDLGGRYGGYCSDLTRNAVLGKVDPEYQKIYDICLASNEAGIKAVRAGVTGVEVDAIAREVIERAGYGQYFGHGLGHGVGLEIHEDPRLSKRATDYKLEPGNIVTIEPGIYLPGKFGVRIEDYALVTEKGCEVLSRAPKQLQIIPV